MYHRNESADRQAGRLHARETDKQRGRQTEREKDKQTDKEREREKRDRQTDVVRMAD